MRDFCLPERPLGRTSAYPSSSSCPSLPLLLQYRHATSPLPSPTSQGSPMHASFSGTRTFSNSCFLMHHKPSIPHVPERIPVPPSPPSPGMCDSTDHVSSPHQQGCHCPLAHCMQKETELLCEGRISCVLVALSE